MTPGAIVGPQSAAVAQLEASRRMSGFFKKLFNRIAGKTEGASTASSRGSGNRYAGVEFRTPA